MDRSLIEHNWLKPCLTSVDLLDPPEFFFILWYSGEGSMVIDYDCIIIVLDSVVKIMNIFAFVITSSHQRYLVTVQVLFMYIVRRRTPKRCRCIVNFTTNALCPVWRCYIEILYCHEVWIKISNLLWLYIVYTRHVFMI